MKKNRFIAYDAYVKLAEKYAEIIDTKSHNAEYERPGLHRLMPDVTHNMNTSILLVWRLALYIFYFVSASNSALG